MVRWLNTADKDFDEAFSALMAQKREAGADVAATVAGIIAEVRRNGDAALIAYGAKFDHATLTPSTLKLSAGEIAAARDACDLEALEALELAAKRIEEYHLRQVPQDAFYTDEAGVKLGWRWTALDSVGLYVPGGTASYPSSVLMNAVAAHVAGVKRIAMVTPATGGAINPLSIEAARLAGVTEIYRVGGAQAVAALAYGTETIAPVDKIVGPGNAFVAAAKRQVFGQVGIDSIAGPSEILIVADGLNNPAWTAADLLSQAEHDVSAQSILITDDAGFARKVEAAVVEQLAVLPRRKFAEQSWENNGAIILVQNLVQGADIANRVAPEHLEIATRDPDAILVHVRHAGAIFLGRYTPEAMGDYIAGPNHVLPTARTARFTSGLSAMDFLKRTSLLSVSPEALAGLGRQAMALARCEGLDAHARSIGIRLSAAQG